LPTDLAAQVSDARLVVAGGWWMSYVHFTRYGTFMMAKETRKHRIYGHQQAGDVPRGGIFLRPAPGVRVDFFRLPMSWSMARRSRGRNDPGIT